jgi:pyridoxal 5'-phosphate synthase pdxS subunit
MATMDMEKLRFGTELIKRGFAHMQKGGVIMDVTNAEQARIAEEAGAIAVMALHQVPADIRATGGVARMADPQKVAEIVDRVTIPVMAKCRIGHTLEARILQTLGVDMIDESEVLTPADVFFHVDKSDFVVPFVCGARNLGEACRRIWEGAAMIRTKGEAGTGNVVEAVRHMHLINFAIKRVEVTDEDDLHRMAGTYAEPYRRMAGQAENDGFQLGPDDPVFAGHTLADITAGIHEVLCDIKSMSRLPVVNFAAGGIATPADAALMMHMGADGVFVGSGIFKSSNPPVYAKATVDAVENWQEPAALAKVSQGLGDAMHGQEIEKLEDRLQTRGV